MASATSADSIVSHAIDASWGSLTEWEICDRTPHALRKWRVNALGGATLSFSMPLQPESPIVEASRSLDTVQNFLVVHDLGFASRAAMKMADARAVVRHSILLDRARECALWFGGTFDREWAACHADCSRRDSGCRLGLSRRKAEEVVGERSARVCWCALHLEPVS